MAPPAYLCFNGVPIASNARTLAYIRNGFGPRLAQIKDCGACSEEFWLFDNDGEPYLTPAADAVPWVSASEPESADFAGFYIIDIEGLDVAGLERPINQRLDDGANLGRARRPARTITVTGIPMGRTCQAATWGVRWLADVLRDNPCTQETPCSGSDLQFLIDCPTDVGSCTFPVSPGPTGFDEQAGPLRRTLRRVGLSSGPEISSRLPFGGGCGCSTACCLPIVTFELTAADPWAYRDEVEVIAPTALSACEVPAECLDWIVVADDATCPDPCDAGTPCAEDPACPRPAAPPDVPIIVDPCACDPLQTSLTCLNLPASAFFDIGDAAPNVHVFAGDTDLRGIKLRFTPNPTEVPPDEVDECGSCFEVNLPFLPASATWHFDASARTSFIVCGGGDTQRPVLSGPDGGPLIWPLFSCPGIAYSLCVEVDCATWNDAATVAAGLVNRHA